MVLTHDSGHHLLQVVLRPCPGSGALHVSVHPPDKRVGVKLSLINVTSGRELTFWPTCPAPPGGRSPPSWAGAPESSPPGRCTRHHRQPAKGQLQRQAALRATGSERPLLVSHSQGGRSRILGSRKLSLRALSWSCWSRKDATLAAVGLQPSWAQILCSVSATGKPSNCSMLAGNRAKTKNLP